MRSAKPILVASAVLLLSSVIVDAASQKEPAGEQVKSDNEEEREHEHIRSTEEAIEYFRTKYKITE